MLRHFGVDLMFFQYTIDHGFRISDSNEKVTFKCEAYSANPLGNSTSYIPYMPMYLL